MHVPQHFQPPSVQAMHDLIREFPLATLVSLSADELCANHIPMCLIEAPAPLGTLRGHVARVNPMWRHTHTQVETLVVFHGPQSYITPAWYASKKESGRVVPTWNYMVVHAYGKLRVIEDRQWLRNQLDQLTRQQEARLAEPWRVSDAPPEYVEQLLGAIVGIELEISKLSGKWKVSQNQSAENQTTVIAGLKQLETTDAQSIANWMTSRLD